MADSPPNKKTSTEKQQPISQLTTQTNRTREQNRPQKSEPSSLKGFQIPELLQMAHSDEKFMYYDSGPQDDERVIVFATLPTIDLLEQSDNWFCDRTCSTAPNVLNQVYTIHASVDGVNLPLVYAVLPDKKRREPPKTTVHVRNHQENE